MKKTWLLKSVSEDLIPQFPEYPRAILKLLAQRGITDLDLIRDFLEPDYGKLNDPFLFKDMQKAVERIWQAIEQKEKILIYADYDADAITACSVMYLALKKAGGLVDFYIPDRFTEGYGMNVEAVVKLKERGVNLIITVDCGINAVEEAKAAKDLGMDLIITDHHELTGKLPDALAVVNPKNPKDNYPFVYLTGVGVAYKVIQGLFAIELKRKAHTVPEGWEKWLLDLVAIGTVADCQSLTGENRILVSYGLKVLAKSKWPGIKALLTAAGVTGKMDAFTLGFVLAPRINAAGRIKHAEAAFRLLISENILEAQNLAIELNELNKHRQLLTEQILSEARAQIELISDRKILLAFGQNWPKGVVGLVAGKLCEEYNRPVLVLDKSEKFATGSARSVESFDIVSALVACKELLTKYGGHKQAAGFTLESQKVEDFYKKLLNYAQEVKYELTDAQLVIDEELAEQDLNFTTLEYVEKLSPFGFGNHKPKFMSKNFELIDIVAVGNGSKHAKMRLRLGSNVFSAIAFNQAYLTAKLTPGSLLDAVYELSVNEWNGLRQMDLKIIDVKQNG